MTCILFNRAGEVQFSTLKFDSINTEQKKKKNNPKVSTCTLGVTIISIFGHKC